MGEQGQSRSWGRTTSGTGPRQRRPESSGFPATGSWRSTEGGEHESHESMLHESGSPAALKALTETDLGLVEQARARRRRSGDIAGGCRTRNGRISPLGVLGRLELMLGNSRGGRATTCAIFPGGSSREAERSDSSRLGRRDRDAGRPRRARAGARVPRAVRAATRGASGGPWAWRGRRCRGLLAAADGDLPGAFAVLERSLAELDGSP